MIAGLERFRDYFREYTEHYVLIGAVAAMQWLDEADLNPRATKDFDIVLLVERLDDEFLDRFWGFVKAGGYNNLQKSTGERIYYRFTVPQASDYPSMLEIFSRAPEGLERWGEPEIIPLPAEDDASSLSAILMDEDYYRIVQENTRDRDGLPLLSPEGLILLKAKAFLDLSVRRAAGETVDEKQIKKHRNDVFKLALLLRPDQTATIPAAVHKDLHAFLQAFPVDAPEWGSIRDAARLGGTVMEPVVLLRTLTGAFQPA